MHRVLVALAAAGGVIFAQLPTAAGQTVWSGYGFTFTKADFAPPSLPENQDRITGNVWISRNTNGGIFNVHDEEEYLADSPADTEWATNINNPSDTIAATNWAALDFDPWIVAYGSPQGSGLLPASLLSRNAVVHLISDDIYLDLQFTGWTAQGGGGFEYERALPPDGPETTGDYNLDGFVDAADYVRWRKTFGNEVPEGSGADGVPDGTIDDADYGFWVSQFGTDVPGSGGGPFAVPEPTGLMSMLLSVLASAIYGCRWTRASVSRRAMPCRRGDTA